MTNAVVVGAGHNGLAAAIHLARNGLDVQLLEAAESVGGGARSGELTVPGVIHDYCSAALAIHAAGRRYPRAVRLSRRPVGLAPATQVNQQPNQPDRPRFAVHSRSY